MSALTTCRRELKLPIRGLFKRKEKSISEETAVDAHHFHKPSGHGMRDDSQRVGVASGQREGRIRFADRVEAHLSRSDLRVTSFCP